MYDFLESNLQYIGNSDDRIRSSILVLVPAVRSTNLDAWSNLLDLLDLADELWSGHVATI
jgi:hypothetical protein